MSEKHYPYIGGSYDRIVFDGDGSVWVPEPENAKLQDENARLRSCLNDDAENARQIMGENAELRQERDLYRELFNLTTQPDRYVQVREENAKLREYVEWLEDLAMSDPNYYRDTKFLIEMKRRELGIEEE